MTPTIGRIVIYTEGSHEGRGANGSNGVRQHPALITRVWSDTCVNLHVFLDGFPSEIRCSVSQLSDEDGHCEGIAGWSWPERPETVESHAEPEVSGRPDSVPEPHDKPTDEQPAADAAAPETSDHQPEP